MKTLRGFTLAEVLIVVAVIAILASVVYPSLSDARKKSRDTQRVSDLAQLQLALRMYRDSNGSYPSYPNGEVIGDGVGLDADLAPYLAGTIKDPLAPQTGYGYYYDSSYSCSAEDIRILIVAATAERSSTPNWGTVCGGTTDLIANAFRPDANSYAVIIK